MGLAIDFPVLCGISIAITTRFLCPSRETRTVNVDFLGSAFEPGGGLSLHNSATDYHENENVIGPMPFLLNTAA